MYVKIMLRLIEIDRASLGEPRSLPWASVAVDGATHWWQNIHTHRSSVITYAFVSGTVLPAASCSVWGRSSLICEVDCFAVCPAVHTVRSAVGASPWGASSSARHRSPYTWWSMITALPSVVHLAELWTLCPFALALGSELSPNPWYFWTLSGQWFWCGWPGWPLPQGWWICPSAFLWVQLECFEVGASSFCRRAWGASRRSWAPEWCSFGLLPSPVWTGAWWRSWRGYCWVWSFLLVWSAAAVFGCSWSSVGFEWSGSWCRRGCWAAVLSICSCSGLGIHTGVHLVSLSLGLVAQWLIFSCWFSCCNFLTSFAVSC